MNQRQRRLGPSYDEENYWDEKFENDQKGFEWLGSGGMLIAVVQKYCLEEISKAATSIQVPRILHLGAGTSTLSLDVARHLKDIYTSKRETDVYDSIINIDFSKVALQIGKDQASQLGVQGMKYVKVDLRNWKDISSEFPLLQNRPMSIILDKSTSDAISTNADVNIKDLDQDSICPLLKGNNGNIFDPLDLVAIHLAAMTAPGSIWAVLSYSHIRFEIFQSDESLSRRYWTIEEKNAIDVPNKSTDNVHAPQIHHWFYLIRRKAS